MRLEMSIKQFRRFVRNIQVCEHGRSCKTCCWNWRSSHYEKGYPRFKIKGRHYRATRIAWVIFVNNRVTIPKGLFALHKCDHPWCINYHHLFIGTEQDNHDDMVRKGRGGKVLGIDKVKEVRRIFCSQYVTINDLSEMFECSESTIRNILLRNY